MLFTFVHKVDTMNYRDLLTDDDAMTPVIGIILMVAITVILAAVTATMVLGFGADESVSPNPSFEVTHFEDDAELEIAIRAGDSFHADQVEVEFEDEDNSVTGYWHEFDGDIDEDAMAGSGDDIRLGSDAGDADHDFDVDGTSWTVEIFWENEDGEDRERIFDDSA